MKTLLFLGGSLQQLPPIRYAKEKGYHTICCDYTPNAPGFDVACQHYQVSTTDKSAILTLAAAHKIDGIVAYASDPAAPTAAYVAEKLGLPGNPYDSVQILTHKDLYRAFLHKHGFAAPKTYENGDHVNLPCVIKPVDSSGSKGVQIIHDLSTFPERLKYSGSFSRCGRVVVEDYIKRDGYQIAGDGFVIDGRLAFCGFAHEHFDPNGGIVPVGESFPYYWHTGIVQQTIQRLIDLLGLRNGALNFDIVLSDGKIYLMEIGPRNGGCLIPQVIKYQSGVDLIAATVESALGHKVELPEPQNNGYYSSCMIHSLESGKFKKLEVHDSINIVEANLWVNVGDDVHAYQNSSHTVGHAILKWDTHLEMIEKMDKINEYVRVVVK